MPTDSPPERPNASAGRSGDDGNVRGAGDDADGDLWDKVSTFGVDVGGLGDAELERQAEAYLAERERQYRGPAEAYLRRQERRYKRAAEDYLGFDRGDVVDGAGDGQEVGHGGD